MFRLPAYQEISKAQDELINLPVEGRHLITGPPGTGKTVVALYRTKILKNANVSSKMLVYNNTLQQYLDRSTGELDINAQTSTFHKWFTHWYFKNFGRRPPQKEPFRFDWRKIFMDLSGKGDSLKKEEHLIIDEGQDFPKELHYAVNFISDNITVFADENQRIKDNNSTIAEIQDNLVPDDIYELKKNYRNTRQIAEFSREFFTGTSTGIPDLPDREGRLPGLILGISYDMQIKVMAVHGKTNPGRQIGIFVRQQKTQYGIYMNLKESTDLPVQMYQSGNKKYDNLDYREKGFFVLCNPSIKGLEFDTVYLPVLDRIRTDANEDTLKMRMYVACSRAREDLFLFTKDETVPKFLQDIPEQLYRIK